MTIRKRWVFAFLFLFALSLAGNLFTGGLILGRHVFQDKAPAAQQAIRRFFQTVPKEARPVVRRHFRDHAGEILDHLRQIRQARAHVAEVMARPELDKAALADAFAQLRARTTALQVLAHGIMMQAVEELPAKDRAEWQKRWRDGVPLR
jgi:uncharacterized membrane protein